jgi:hypothetical protein
MDFDTIIGLAMLASWGYSIYIIANKLEKTTRQEKFNLWFSVITFVLFVIGATSN